MIRRNRQIYMKQWYEANKKNVMEKNRQWNANNPERRHRSLTRGRAKRKGVPFDLTLSVYAGRGLPCPICQSRPALELDRIVPSLGYVDRNVAWLCCKCNLRKQDSSAEDLRKIADWLEREIMERYGK